MPTLSSARLVLGGVVLGCCALCSPIRSVHGQSGSGTVSALSNIFRAGGNAPTLDGQDPFMISLAGSGPFWSITFAA
ncbi:MAG: hypothetical protein KC544_14745, partial [Gemmatimonadetes bacterium]|nr:hypothetical protein [Gemmatimonadota bacterium]